jgi:hypothetical protein
MADVTPLQRCEIARNDNYLAFPDVALTRGGVLVCAYFEGDLHSPNWSQIVLKTSTDWGATWSAGVVLARASYEDDGHCWNCPRLSVLPDGRLILICDYEDRSEERAVWAWWSHDEGESWSEPVRILDEGLCPDRVVALPSGRLLLSADCDEKGQNLFTSDDGGTSWVRHSTIHPPPACESSVVPLDGDTLVCYLRGGQFFSPKAVSADGGDTWPRRGSAPFIGHRPCAGLLRSGNVLLTFRLPGAGTYAYLESQESALSVEREAQRGALLELDSGDANYWWDYGYSGWVQLPDSRIFCVYYTKPQIQRVPSPEPKPFVKGAWFSESDFPAL